MNDNKCEFCNGTGVEPGQAGCVWCGNTGTKEGQQLSSTEKMASASKVTPGGMVKSIKALLDLDARNALAPHGIGGLARDLFTKCAEVLSRSADQHQGEPVAVVDESDDGLFIDFIYGENGSPLKRGDKLYTHPAPVEQDGEPVAEVTMIDPLVLTKGSLLTLKVGDKLYTHADAGEVERLRDALMDIARKASESRSVTRRLTWIEGRAQSALEGKDWAKHVFQMPDPRNAAPKAERLRAELANLRKLHASTVHQLAELREVMADAVEDAKSFLASDRGWDRYGTRRDEIEARYDAALAAQGEQEVKP